MDTLKGQDNTEIKALCLKIDCKLVIMPHNLTNKFQPLDISINQKAKKFISHKFNTWYVDVKVSMKISDLKPLHAHWIVNMYTYLKQQKHTTQNHREYGFFLHRILRYSRSPYAMNTGKLCVVHYTKPLWIWGLLARYFPVFGQNTVEYSFCIFFE